MTVAITHFVEDLYPRLIAGEPRAMLRGFSPRARVDSPLRGRQDPMEWALDESRWLAARNARVDIKGTVSTNRRVANESILWVTIGGQERELPVLIVADTGDEVVRDLRIYHSTWPLTGGHVVRPPLIEPDPAAHPAEPFASYERALAVGDVDALDSLFEPDGYVREPAGSAYLHAGAAREEFYGPMRATGGVSLKPMTVTDDGISTVVEYLCDQWGGTTFQPQAGAAVWERSPSGKIAGVRIYDDVTPPRTLRD